jgi:membrane protease YdiL (CAAX protease family)
MATPSDQPLEPEPRRGRPLGAWFVIAVAVVTAFTAPLLLERRSAEKRQTEDVVLALQARELVAAAQLDRTQAPKMFRDIEPQTKKAPDAVRLRIVVALAGELAGPDEALRQLRDLDVPDDDRHLAELLERLYDDYRQEKSDAPSLSGAERAELQDQLGWFGALALHPPGGPDAETRAAILRPAQHSLYLMLGAIGCIVALGFVGLNLLILMAILLAQGKVRLRFATGSPNGGIYAETFALWMVLFMGLGLGASFLPLGHNYILVGGLLALGSLSALAWPVFRGVPWRTVRQEIGLAWTDLPTIVPLLQQDDPYIGYPHDFAWDRLQKRCQEPFLARQKRFLTPFLEPVFGFASYLGTLPLLFAGAAMTLGLMRLAKLVFGPAGDPWGLTADPNHPIGGMLLTADWWGKFQILFAACVGAPIVEETMFRGVLYRHLREATGRWARWWSVLASAAVVSFVFAVIHPQGLLAVPALMSLAIGFSLAREWRGSLVPSMVAHGLNNLMVTVLLLMSAG